MIFCACCRECDPVGECASQTNQSVAELSKNTGIHRFIDVCWSHYAMTFSEPEEHKVPISLLLYSWAV